MDLDIKRWGEACSGKQMENLEPQNTRGEKKADRKRAISKLLLFLTEEALPDIQRMNFMSCFTVSRASPAQAL